MLERTTRPVHKIHRPQRSVHKIVAALTEIRQAWKYPVSRIAEKVGSTGRQLYKCEAGEADPKLSLLVKWADAMGYELVLRPKS